MMVTFEERQQKIREFTLELAGIKWMPANGVQLIMDKFDKLFSETLLEFYYYDIQEDLGSCSLDERGSIRVKCDQSKYPFKHVEVSSLNRRLTTYRKKTCYFDPEVFLVGQEINHKETDDGEDDFEFQSRFGVHIPMRYSLKNILELPQFYEEIIKYRDSLIAEKVLITNVMQGTFWRENYITDKKLVFPLFLFIDDLETGNALGSHSGKQKLTACFIQLPFLPPHLCRKLEFILLVNITYAKQKNLYGNKSIYSKLIEEFKFLANEGIDINVSNKSIKVFFQLCAVVGDHLAVNGATGFVENFSKVERFCLFCRADINECKLLECEVPELMRNENNYTKDVLAKSLSTGIKEECVFHEIPGYHITRNRTLDLMHDINEGIIQYTLSYMLTTYIVKKKLFSLELLNDRIKKFDFGDSETNTPQPLTIQPIKSLLKQGILGTKSKVKFKQSAAESLCLFRHLGVIIGDIIPTDDEHWKLYKYLRKIINIVFAPGVVDAEICDLDHLISKFNKLFIKLYKYLVVKYHLFTHSPAIYKKLGPLIGHWSMPFERENKLLKDLVVTNKCQKNVPLTIAKKYQLHITKQWENTNSFPSKIEIGPISDKLDSEIKKINPKYPACKTISYLKILGKIFQEGTIVVTGFIPHGWPIFRRVHKIFKVDNRALILFHKINVVDFNDHYHAYEVEITQQTSDLIHPNLLPLFIHTCTSVAKNNTNYIVTKYAV